MEALKEVGQPQDGPKIFLSHYLMLLKEIITQQLLRPK